MSLWARCAQCCTCRRHHRNSSIPGGRHYRFPALSLNGYALGHLKTDQSLAADDERLTALSSKARTFCWGFYEEGGVRTYNPAA